MNQTEKQAKSTPPDTVTWTNNTYFRVINLYMCEKHRSDVSKLGQPPTMAELDTRRFRHKYIFDRLEVTYLDDDDDDDDDDCNLLAFFWKWIMGKSWNCCWLDSCKNIWCLVIQRVFHGHGVHQPSLSINWLIETTRSQEAMILSTLLLGSHPLIVYYYHLGCARFLTC